MNILLLTAHDIAEYDDLRMLTDLGYNVFSIGAYTDPAHPESTLRPALPDAPYHPDLAEACREQRERHADDPMTEWIAGELHNLIDWAKADLPQKVIDWADVIICHHYLQSWIVRQWPRLREKRVIWRTCGQSNALLEEVMAPLHAQGLQIVRYSPAEERAFTRLGTWAGQDTLIRFGKYPDDYGPWIGDEAVVGNVTQNMVDRGEFCGYPFWLAATEGFATKPAGIGSEALPGGIGALTYPAMLEYLRHVRAYLYTGTQPASYTLGLIEAMMTGTPVVSIPPEFLWIPDLFEGHEISGNYAGGNDGYERSLGQLVATTRTTLTQRLARPAFGASEYARERAIELFDVAHIGPQWVDLLGSPVRELASVA